MEQDDEGRPVMARRGDTHTRWELGEDWHEHPSYIEAAWCAALAGAVYQERVKQLLDPVAQFAMPRQERWPAVDVLTCRRGALVNLFLLVPDVTPSG